jgi:hypothetical protein
MAADRPEQLYVMQPAATGGYDGSGVGDLLAGLSLVSVAATARCW